MLFEECDQHLGVPLVYRILTLGTHVFCDVTQMDVCTLSNAASCLYVLFRRGRACVYVWMWALKYARGELMLFVPLFCKHAAQSHIFPADNVYKLDIMQQDH